MLSSQGKTKFDSLISNLERLVNKRELGALANLRKGLTGRPGDSVATYRHVLHIFQTRRSGPKKLDLR